MIHTAKWYTLAAEQGDADSQFKIGSFYREGIGIPENINAAVQWFKKAAEQGHSDSMMHLSISYFSGHPLKMDHTAAYMWAEIAQIDGNVKGFNVKKYMAVLESAMNRSQIKKAKKLARECIAEDYKEC